SKKGPKPVRPFSLRSAYVPRTVLEKAGKHPAPLDYSPLPFQVHCALKLTFGNMPANNSI
ncbi:MAG TPA: hypothetical protein VFM69_01365, partial [Pricia sp.]|nr:hypothetical protein [Pricia sp.]